MERTPSTCQTPRTPAHRSLTPGITFRPGRLRHRGGAASQLGRRGLYTIVSATSAAVISPTQLFKGNDNLGIAFSATIENIIGSAGADQFTGNSAANVIEGNAGNDTIAGGGGDDYAVFNGNYADYSITGSYASSYQVVDNNTADGNDGTDTISGVEFFEFADMTYNTVTGNLSNTSSGGALGGSASGTATTVAPTATSVAVGGGGGGGGGGAPPKTVAATVSIDGSSMMTSAKFAAAHGLRGLNLATREGREEALIILSISMATTGGQGSSLSSSLAALNSSMADGERSFEFSKLIIDGGQRKDNCTGYCQRRRLHAVSDGSRESGETGHDSRGHGLRVLTTTRFS